MALGGTAATVTLIVKRSAVALTVLALLNGCVALPRGAAVPASATLTAKLAECSHCRYFPSLDIEPLLAAAMRSNERERAAAATEGSDTALLPASYLAISERRGFRAIWEQGSWSAGPRRAIAPPLKW